MSDLERRLGESLEQYIARLESPDTAVLDADARVRLRDALNEARAQQQQTRLIRRLPRRLESN
jgi:hypothetical protein